MQTVTVEPQSNEDWDLNTTWIVSAKQANSILSIEGTIFLDARSLIRRLRYSIPEAKPIDWQDWSESKLPVKGKLLPKEKVISLLDMLKIKADTYIIVVGAGKDGWGEEGRLVYSLREWGYNRSYWVDGGDTFLLAGKKNKEASFKVKSIEMASKYTISKEELSKNLNNLSISIIDTREEREFHGSTPYGEVRGGHIPGAKWIYFKEFLTEDGRVKSRDEVHKLLTKNNIKIDNSIITYCTGGVRSAIVMSILVSYGISSKNYAGSMWEWSAATEKDFPLQK